jgi:serpin B
MAGTAQVQSLVASNTTFALNLYRQLATNSGNLFFSPYSISMCLAMLYAGASGNTEQQMSQVLGFATNQQQFASIFGDLQRELETNQEPNVIELNIANALWTQVGYPFLPAFLATATNQYQANINQADFVTEADAMTEEINNWVAQETQNKIQNILSPGMVNPDTVLVLANAIYFLGVWTTSFEATNTSTQPFYLSNTSQVDAPLMHQPVGQVKFNYLATSDFQAIELPYGSNQVSMVILLPWQADGLGRLEQELSPALLSNVLAQMTEQQVEVFLPRFTLESTFGLNDTLASMGMPDAFTPFVADFSGIDGMKDLYVSFVIHKAWGEVNEVGTQAAAATVTGIGFTAVPVPDGPPVFRADHPFIFSIRDTQSGSVLFLGRLANPNPSATPALMPQLTGTRSGNTLTISWPSSSIWTLQQSPDLANWTQSGGSTSSDGTNNSMTLTSPPSSSLFFRLRHVLSPQPSNP